MKNYTILFFLIPLLINAQETILKIDSSWVHKLEKNYNFIKTSSPKFVNQDNWNQVMNRSLVQLNYNSVSQKYLNKYKSYKWLPKVFGLGRYYFPLFEAKLKQYGLPTELKYLAVVESNLNPRAISHVGASGLWQFMPATGHEYGLRKNQTANIFYDPLASTDAACRYLKYLYKILGDWNLVLSAYNAGQGTVLKAIKKAGTKNYWKVRTFLPGETKAYVPSFHAIKVLGESIKINQGIKISFLQLKKVKINRQTTIDELKNKGLKTDNFTFFNPQIITNTIPKNAIIYLQN